MPYNKNLKLLVIQGYDNFEEFIQKVIDELEALAKLDLPPKEGIDVVMEIASRIWSEKERYLHDKELDGRQIVFETKDELQSMVDQIFVVKKFADITDEEKFNMCLEHLLSNMVKYQSIYFPPIQDLEEV